MKIPNLPPVGHLISYEYLWASRKGQEDGEGRYPAAVIMSRSDMGPVPVAYVLGISHSPPRAGQRAIEIPLKLERYLGLDSEPSWVYTDEVNIFAWPGPDIRPAEWLSTLPSTADTCVIGKLPSDWFDELKQHFEESYRMRLLLTRKRTT